jgi:UDP-N-acetylglucosamine 2-epimerase (hydrolysing)
VVYPNNDSGTEIIMEEFLRLKDNPHFRIFPSIRFEYFLTLLKHASFILGNSSVGVREAPVFGVPTINLGTRQKNRNNSSLIINISDDKNLILETLSNLPQTVVPSYDFGDGGSAKRFLQILQKTGLWQISRQKQFQDVPFLPFENKR